MDNRQEVDDFEGYPRLSDKKLIKFMIKLFVIAVYVFVFLKIVFLD